MNKCLLLTKILLKTSGETFGSSTKSAKKRRIFNSQLFLYIFVTVCLAPMAFLLFKGGGLLYNMLAPQNLEYVAYTLLCAMLVLMTLIFSLPYVMSVLFFAKDLEYLIPLPLNSWQIAGAKFLTIMAYEYYAILLIGVPLVLGIGIAAGKGLLFWIIALLILLFIPVLPIVYGSVIGLLTLRLTRRFKNKEGIMTFFSVLLMLGGFGISFLASYLGEDLDAEMIMEIITGNRQLLTGLEYLFPNIFFAKNALLHDSLSHLCIYLLITLAVILLYLAVSSHFYLTNVVGMNEASEKRKVLSRHETDKALRSTGIIQSCALREWKLLVRTPVYFLNCTTMPLILPLILLIPIVTALMAENSLEPALLQIRLMSSFFSRDVLSALVLLSAFALAALVTSSNLTVSTCISREGQNVMSMKHIPVPYATQLKGKVLCGVCISLVAVIPYVTAVVLAGFCIFKTSWLLLFPALFVGILTTLLTCYIQLLGDLWKPKLVWTSEQVPVKQNFIAMLSMLLCYIVYFALGAGCVFLYWRKVPVMPLSIGAVLLLTMLTFVVRMWTYRYAVRAFERME